MDLSKIEGLTEEQQAAITAQFTTETEGLRNKNEQLLGEKKTAQQLATEKEEMVEQARAAATKAEEEKLKVAGDMDGLKSHYEKQLAEQTAAANESAKKAQETLRARDKSTVLNDALSLIHDDFKDVAKAQLSNMLEISYNDEGLAVSTFTYDGKSVATDVDSFKSWAGEQSMFKNILKGVTSSGGNTSQSGGAMTEGMTLTQKAIAANKAGASNY